MITAFTIGHSITLVFATLIGIKANYYLIDAVIALTVCYKAFENLDGFKKYLNSSAPNLILMVFIFGLIHGFGLSTRLQQLPLGEEHLVLKILSFNLGVELGQVIVLSIIFVLLFGLRKRESFKKFSAVSNVALLFVGGLLLLMQLHGYQHSTHPDEFPINADDHHHIHEALEQKSSLSDDPEKINLLNEEPVVEAPIPDVPEKHSHNGGRPHHH